MGVLGRPDLFYKTAVYWFEDNASVLAGLIRGASREAELDNGAASLHTVLAALQCRVWFEWIESKANWADGASRELEQHRWTSDAGFQFTRQEVPVWPWAADPEERVAHAKQVCSSLEQRWAGGASLGEGGREVPRDIVVDV